MESTDDHTHQPAINVELKTAEILEIFDRQVFNQFKKCFKRIFRFFDFVYKKYQSNTALKVDHKDKLKLKIETETSYLFAALRVIIIELVYGFCF